jgi:hypothetical protein
MLRRKSNIASRWQKLFVPDDGQDSWIEVDPFVLDELYRRLRRLPPGWKARSLDFSRMSDVRTLPRDLRCAQLNLSGTSLRALPHVTVEEHLDLHGCRQLERLPSRLKVRRLDLQGCTALTHLPGDMCVDQLSLHGCTNLKALPSGLRCSQLDLGATRLRCLPDDLQVRARLSLRDCRLLEALPAGLRVSILDISGCTGLRALPPALDVFDLNMEGCTDLSEWPESACVARGRVLASGCRNLTRLSPYLTELEVLDVHDCTSLRELPGRLHIRNWIDIGNTGVRELPPSVQGAMVRWRGVTIDPTFAFHHERIRVADILGEHNMERRRLYLEWFGTERFMKEAGARVLDTDDDAGGERRLLEVQLANDEPLVCVSVRCPSTGRQYMLRVPPTMTTCREAVAWTAGFDDPEDYAPVVET